MHIDPFDALSDHVDFLVDRCTLPETLVLLTSLRGACRSAKIATDASRTWRAVRRTQGTPLTEAQWRLLGHWLPRAASELCALRRKCQRSFLGRHTRIADLEAKLCMFVDSVARDRPGVQTVREYAHARVYSDGVGDYYASRSEMRAERRTLLSRIAAVWRWMACARIKACKGTHSRLDLIMGYVDGATSDGPVARCWLMAAKWHGFHAIRGELARV